MKGLPINCFPAGRAWRTKILWYIFLSRIPIILLNGAIPWADNAAHIIRDPPPCFIVGTRQKDLNISPKRRRTNTRRFDKIKLNFGLVRPKDLIPLIQCPIYVLFRELKPLFNISLPQYWFSGGNSSIKPKSIKSPSYRSSRYCFTPSNVEFIR